MIIMANKKVLSRCVLAMLSACMAPYPALAEIVTGTWSGKLQIQGVSLGIVFHIGDEPGSGALPVVTMDSPDQGVKGIPVQTDYFSADSISVSSAALAMKYSGRLEGDVIDGTFTQMGRSLPLSLTRGEEVRLRPQTPRPPYPYKSSDVTFRGAADDVMLAGTLTMPDSADGDTPVVLMVSGSGLQDRDETLFGHKPFAVIADRLARAGIGSLRYDDRGVAPSTGNPDEATTMDFAGDASGGLEWLRGQGYGNVGILGHSEGGAIAFILSDKADFIVTLGASAISGNEVLLYQIDGNLEDAGLSAEERLRAGKVLRAAIDSVTAHRELDTAQARLVFGSAMTEGMERYADRAGGEWAVLNSMKDDPAMLLQPWMRYFLSYDPAADIRKAGVPALALYGAKDVQVRADRNVGPMRSLNPGVRVKVYDGLNHLMQPCVTGKAVEYGQIETTVDDAVMDDIIKFIETVR